MQEEQSKNILTQLNDFCLDEIIHILEPQAFDLISDFSMTAYGLAFIKNEIILNNRQDILELGSGLSTIFMGLLIKKNHLNAKITSIENSEDWFKKIKEKINLLELSQIVNIVHAPLLNNEKFGSSPWYDEIKLNNEINVQAKFDMVLIDGPPAYYPVISKSRFGAGPFIQGKLKESYVIILDDAIRAGEKEVISMWNEQYNYDFNLYNNRIGVSRKGNYSNSDPIEDYLNRLKKISY